MIGVSQSRREFLESEIAALLRKELQAMVDDPRYNTRVRYSLSSPSSTEFVTKHMKYMSNFPLLNHRQYVANLKLMTKLKQA